MKRTACLAVAIMVTAFMVSSAEAGQKKLMTVKKAKLLAQRALVESVFGLKVKSEESVTDILQARFFTTGAAKTEASVAGIKIEDVVYDPEKDIARATASITLAEVSAQTGIEFPNPEKKFSRVGFATSSRERLDAVKAMRVAEIDAYTSLAKETLGFELKSGTTVENYILKSDEIKTKMIAALFLADLVDYGWDEEKNAYVTLQVDMDTLALLMGETMARTGVVKVTGYGASVMDYEEPEVAAGKKAPALVKEGALDVP